MTYHDVIRDRDQASPVMPFDENIFYIYKQGLVEYWQREDDSCRLLMTSLKPIN